MIHTTTTTPTPSQRLTSRRPSWRGIIAGLLLGLVVSMAMFLLALVLGSFLSLELQGASITAGVYSAITALLSAFTAGYFAIKASAPELLFGDGADIDPRDATLTGVITAAAIIVISTFTMINGATSAVRTAGNVVGTTVSAVGSATGSVASAVGSVASNAGVAAMAGVNSEQGQEMTGKLQEAYQKATGNVSRDDIEGFIAKNSANLDQAQVSAVANVLEDLLVQTKEDAKTLDLTNLDTWKNLDEYAKERLVQIENALTGDELITRLTAQGLSPEQATQVRDEAVATYQEYKAKSEQAMAEARQTLEQAKQKADEAVQQAKETARKAALYTGLFGLIAMALTFFASIAGAKAAAAKARRR